ncbi:hypothetical protein ACFHW2_12130 [Actinomadura sp. LOL_016]|uniref:hypothetical protein n=1 Tax=unclassified Actinomadura TaxID=2626254 RepID=UPI003A80B3CB
MPKSFGRVLTQVPSRQTQTRTRCGHAAPTRGCRVCEAEQTRTRRPGRLRGKGWTKSPHRKPRRNRRRR